MIVCHCRVVNDAAVRAVMDAGETAWPSAAAGPP